MTPPTTASRSRAPGDRRHARAPVARPPRRVSGPARRPAAPPARQGGGAALAPPLALRLAAAAARIGDARFLDRLVRGRAWIALVAAGLMGIVFMQVSMLRLNAGISRDVTNAEALKRQNATLRGDISELGADERVQDAARAAGLVMPAAGSVNYLDARKADPRAAARAIKPPNPDATAALAPASTTTPVVATPAPVTTAAAAVATTPTAATTPATTTTPAAIPTPVATPTTTAATTTPAITPTTAVTTTATTATTTTATTSAATTSPTTVTATPTTTATPAAASTTPTTP